MRVTLQDVAQAVQLAPSTVSRALRGSPEIRRETRERVAKAAAALGYEVQRPAVSTVTGGHLVVAVHIDGGLAVPHEIVLQGIREYAEHADVGVVLVSPTATVSSIQSSKLLEAAAGALFIMPHRPLPLMGALRDKGLLVAVANRSASQLAPGPVDIAVHADERDVAKQIVAHLHTRGHRQLAFAGDDRDNCMMTSRAALLRDAVIAAGLPSHERSILADAFADGGASLVSLLRDSVPPTALVCASDHVALRALRTLREAGFDIPGDISIVGVHNLELVEYVTPALTTVEIPLKAIGYEAARLLHQWLPDSPNRHIDVTFPVRLIERASVRSLRG